MAERVSLDIHCNTLQCFKPMGILLPFPKASPPPLINKHLGCSKNAQLYAIKEDFHYNGLDTNTITNH